MKKENSLILFNQKKVRRNWDDNKEQWYFPIVDVVAILTDSSNPRRYWSDLKTKLKQEGSEVYEKIVQLKWKRNCLFQSGESDSQVCPSGLVIFKEPSLSVG